MWDGSEDRKWASLPNEIPGHRDLPLRADSDLWHHDGRLLFSYYSSFLRSGATEAELAFAAAPLLSLLLSWLSILACSRFTSSSSSACRRRGQKKGLKWLLSGAGKTGLAKRKEKRNFKKQLMLHAYQNGPPHRGQPQDHTGKWQIS